MRCLSLLALAFLIACPGEPPKDTNTDDTAPDSAPDDTGFVDADGDGHSGDDDCDDGDASVYVGAAELCNAVDDDCDGTVDEDAADLSTWHADADGDTYGDPAVTEVACEAPPEHVADGSDCDDASAAYHPGADEPDCTDPNDYNCDGSVGYADADADGFAACTDCDDTTATTNSAALESCNGVDDNCDGAVDEATAVDARTWYLDSDGDTYGDADVAQVSCDAPADYVLDGTDCDDADSAFNPGADESDCTDPNDYNCDASVGYADLDGDGHAACAECDDLIATTHPGAAESCNGADDNCDGAVDEGVTTTLYADVDGDGFGDLSAPSESCGATEGYVADATDCDDRDGAVHPDATERCDGADNDCDGTVDEATAVDAPTWYFDGDEDTYGEATDTAVSCAAPRHYVSDATDCDDGAAAVNPAAAELCDSVDNDCDGAVDEDAAVDAPTWYFDGDEDTYGEATDTAVACAAPLHYVADQTDCDDGAAAINPAADEVCDGADNNCDGTVDEASAADASTWYHDGDEDGYGDPEVGEVACEAPADHVSNASDCDDGAAAINPGAAEGVADGIDQNCDGAEACWTDADGDDYGTSTAVASADTDCADAGEADVGGDCLDTGTSAAHTWPGAAALDSASACMTDADRDGYGADSPGSGVTAGSDCDDADATEVSCSEVSEHIGNDVEFATASSHAANYLLGSLITVPDTMTVTDLALIGKTAVGSVKMGLYTDVYGNPGTLVVSTPGTPVVDGVEEIPVTPTVIPAGDYWIMGVYSATASIGITYADDATKVVKYRSYSYSSALPTTFGSPSTYTGQEFNYYIVGY
ncbi:MAG: putative metal-binding motif-containing protein [Pseudomonadota bacterium]|nr:putative metal-binding motif-containing protein [Pseudomonadota bacterium]